jgi:cytochrome c
MLWARFISSDIQQEDGMSMGKLLGAVVATIVLLVVIGVVGDLVYKAGAPSDVQVAAAPEDAMDEAPAASEADTAAAPEAAAPEPTEEAASEEAAPEDEVVAGDDATGEGTMEETASEGAAPDEAASAETADEDVPAAEDVQTAAAGGAVAGDPEAGKKATRVCAACHTFDAGGPNRVGPNLHDVFGSDIASHDGFKYSAALQGVEGNWTADKLDAWLTSPKAFAPGNKMTFAGVKDDTDRQNVIAYLASLKN